MVWCADDDARDENRLIVAIEGQHLGCGLHLDARRWPVPRHRAQPLEIETDLLGAVCGAEVEGDERRRSQPAIRQKPMAALKSAEGKGECRVEGVASGEPSR